MQRRSEQRRHASGFTLVEVLVSLAVLTFLVLLVNQLFSGATRVTTLGNKRMETQAQARPLFDRMQVDFAQMPKRADLDYYVKTPSNAQTGNDQIAFFSEVTGYASGSPGTVSLISYRINGLSNSAAYMKLQRMSKGLVWHGTATNAIPVVFLPLTISGQWSAATTTSTADTDYDLYGPQVFRFEYRYVLKNGAFSITPWDANRGSTAVDGLRDVAAVVVAIATIDPQSKMLVTDAQLSTLAGAMGDFDAARVPGALEQQWQAAALASALPKPAASSIKIYSRYFSLAGASTGL